MNHSFIKGVTLMVSTLLLSSHPPLHAKKIFFDLGDVLLEPSKQRGLQLFGIGNVLKFFFSCGKSPKKEYFLDFLIKHYGKDVTSSLPACYRNWMTGKKSSAELVAEIESLIKNDPSLKPAERTFFSLAANNMSPTNLAHIMQPNKKALKTIKECLQSLDENGMRNSVYIISNWDADSFELVKRSHPELFSLFKDAHIITSGVIGLMKPDPAIFEYVIDTFNLKNLLKDCIFIDDLSENTQSAQACGFKTITHTHWRSTHKTLKEFGVFGPIKKK